MKSLYYALLLCVFATASYAQSFTLFKSDGGDTIDAGSTVTYTLIVRNTGTTTESMRLNEIVPVQTSFLSGGSSDGWSCPGGSLQNTPCAFDLPDVAPGETRTVRFRVLLFNPVNAGRQEIENLVTLTPLAGGLFELNDSDTTPLGAATGPDLVVTISDRGATASPGATIVYDVTVANTGNQDTNGVVLTEVIPVGTTLNAAASRFWSCAGSQPGDVCTAVVGHLSPRDGVLTYPFGVTVSSSIPPGLSAISNTAGAADDGARADLDPSSNSASEVTPLASVGPDLALAKAGPLSASAGATAAYVLVVTNNGSQSASGVSIAETVPAHTTFNAGASDAGWSCAGGSPAGTACGFTVGTLAIGASTSVTFAVTVVDPVPAGVTSLNNSATASEDGSGGGEQNPGDNSASATTPLTGSGPDLALAKTGPASAAPGATVSYQLVLTNNGNQDASGVAIAETVPAHTTFDAGASGTGWSCADGSPAGTACTFTVSALAAGASGAATFAVTVDDPLPAGVTSVSNSATVSDDGSGGGEQNPGDNSASVTTPLTGIGPDLALAKTGPPSAMPGDRLVYQLVVTNNGNQDASGVSIDETVPAHTTFAAGSSDAGWSCADGSPAGTACGFTVGNLAAGGSRTVVFAVAVLDPLPAGVMAIANSAAASEDGSGGGEQDPGDDGATLSTPLTSATGPDLALAKSGPASAAPGDTVPYQLAVANNGNQDASGVMLAETVPDHTTFNAAASGAGWSCPGGSPGGTSCTFAVGNVAAGASATAVFAVDVLDPLPAGVTEIANAATVSEDGSGGGDQNPGNDGAAISTPLTPGTGPDLALTKTAPGSAAPGATLAYDLVVANDGNQDASGVTLAETVPDHTTFNAAASGAGWSCPGGAPAGTSCTFAVGNVAAGASVTAVFAVDVLDPLPAGVMAIANAATVSEDGSGGGEQDPGNDGATLSTPLASATGPNLALAKSGPGSAAPGDTLTYVLVVTNNGDQDAAGVAIDETVPAHTTFAAGPADADAAWSCADGSPAGTPCGLTVGNLAAGASTTVTFAVVVVDPLPAGVTEIVNSAAASEDGSGGGEQDPGDDGATLSIPLTPAAGPDLALAKTGPASVAPGDTVSYQLAVTNNGNQDASGVTLAEVVPDHTTFNAAASDAGWSCPGGSPGGTSCTFAVGNVAAGASASVVFAVNVVDPLPAGVTEIANAATASEDGSGGGDQNPGDDGASISTPLTPGTGPDLALTKTGPGSAAPGATLAYDLVVANDGNQDASGVTLAETVPGHTTFNAAASGAGWSCPDGSPAGTSCTFAVGNVAAGASATAVFAVDVQDPLPAGAMAIVNAATASEDGSGGGEQDPGDDGATASTPLTTATGPNLALAKSGPGSAAPGDTLTYVLVVTNNGDQDAAGVAIDETVPAYTTFAAGPADADAAWSCADGSPAGTPCSATVGSLAAGASATVTFAVVVLDPLPAGVTEIVNSATASEDGSGGGEQDPGDDGATLATPLDPAAGPDLVILKTGPPFATPGATTAYDLSVTNDGNQDAAGVAFAEVVPDHTTFNAAASDPGWSCPDGSPAGTPCALLVGDLAAGGSRTVAFAVDVLDPLPAGVREIVNAASVSEDGGELADDTSVATPLAPAVGPNLALTKTGPGAAAPGNVLTYDLVVGNTGNQDAAGVTLAEVVPEHTTFEARASEPGWSCLDGSPAGTPCTFTVGGVAAGAPVTVVFAVRVVQPLPAGVTEILNGASVSEDGSGAGEQDPTDDSAAATTPISPDTGPNLALAKTGPGSTAPGATIVYELTVTNHGNQDAAGVRIDETVPAYTSFVAAASDSGWGCQDGAPAGTACGFAVGDVAVGASATVLFAVRVLDPLPSTVTAIENTATVSNDGSGGNEQDPGDDTTEVSTPLEPPTAGVDVALRMIGPPSAKPGALLAYRLVLTNLGDQAAAGVTVTETVPEHTTFTAASSAPGWICAKDAPAGTACVLTIPSLGPGDSTSLTFAVTVDRPVPMTVTSIGNAASVAHPDDHDPDNDRAFLTTPLSVLPTGPDVAISKGAVESPIAGSTVKYLITVMNLGKRAATVTVYERPSYPPADFVMEYGWACDDEMECRQQVIAKPGETLILDFFVDIPADAVHPLVNEASAPLPSDEDPTNNTAYTTDNVISIQDVPTISPLGVILLTGFLMTAAFVVLRRRTALALQ